MKKRDLELIQIALHHVVNECRKVQNITASDIGALACQELVREYDRISQLIGKLQNKGKANVQDNNSRRKDELAEGCESATRRTCGNR